MIQRLENWRTALTGLGSGRRALWLLGFGALSGGALAPFHLVFLLLPGFAAVLWLLAVAERRRSAFAVGWWFGIGHFAVGFYWIAEAFLVDAPRYGLLAAPAVIALALGMALFTGGTTLATWWLARPARFGGPARAAVFAAAWTLFEVIRGWIFTGLPWNPLGSAWAFSDAMMQPAALVGAFGLSLATALLCALPAAAAGSATKPARPLVAAFALAMVWLAFGLWRAAGIETADVEGVRLRLVQPNIPQHLKWVQDLRAGHVRKQLRMSVEKTASPPPTLVIWAETAVPYVINRHPALLKALASAVPENGHLVTGTVRDGRGDGMPSRIWNSLYAVAGGGRVAAVYDKRHLVPFGEYVPFRHIFKFSKLTSGRVDFSPGIGDRTLQIEGAPPFAPLICYEAIFPFEVAALGTGPAWLLNVTNDGWFGRSVGPYQHLAQVRLRAVEMGVPIVRVANTGISAVIDPVGRVLTSLPLLSEGVIDSGLPGRLPEPPLFAKWPTVVTTLVILLPVILAWAFGGRMAPSRADD